MSEGTISTNMRIPADLHKRMAGIKQQVGLSINDQIVAALRRYDAVSHDLEETRRALKDEQIARERAEAQVALLRQLLSERSGQQLRELAEAYKSALRDVALATARVVQRAARPSESRQRSMVGRRGRRFGQVTARVRPS